MSDHFDDPKETVWITIPLDGETVARLENLSGVCHAEMETVAASLLHDILKDDDEAHFLLAVPAVGASFN